MTLPSKAKGWCPGAYRPMMSGDGLIVRIRPVLAQFDAAALRRVCDLAVSHGNGILELTNRANLQMRGVTEDRLQDLLQALGALELLDADPALEERRNILTEPHWTEGDMTQALSCALHARLSALPSLSAKFGFAVDTGPAPRLAGCSADIRLERDMFGNLILRADGAETGCVVRPETAIDTLIELAHWFANASSNGTKRMAQLLAHMPLPARWQGNAPAPAAPPLGPSGAGLLGQHVALPFGRIKATDLRNIIATSASIRVTPFRILILDAPADIAHPAIITKPDDPLLAVNACPGAPHCVSASVRTHEVARQLAPHISGQLHVSGCAKGCAHNALADVTLVGRNGAFDIIHNGTAQTLPSQTSVPVSRIAQTVITETT